MIKVIVLGGGNLAFHLTNEFLKSSEVDLVQVYNRNIENISYLKTKTNITNQLSKLKDADIYIICVSDNAIYDLSEQLNFENKLVVHTSGAMDLDTLKSNSNKGVFYPLQSFSKDKKVDFSTIPICIEVNNKKDIEILEKLALSITTNCYPVNSKQRKQLHVAAVFVNNFVNHLYYIGNEVCAQQKIPFEILEPLIKETALKINTLSPFEAQTGPARRKDTETIKEHLEILNKNQQEIYKLLTQSIIDTYERKKL